MLGQLALRALAGGLLVVVFSAVAEVVHPKAFSGLFSAAPSVAVASLSITVAFKGAPAAREAAVGMIVGAVGMCACCAAAAVTIPRVKAMWGSAIGVAAWGAVAFAIYGVVFRAR